MVLLCNDHIRNHNPASFVTIAVALLCYNQLATCYGYIVSLRPEVGHLWLIRIPLQLRILMLSILLTYMEITIQINSVRDRVLPPLTEAKVSVRVHKSYFIVHKVVIIH